MPRIKSVITEDNIMTSSIKTHIKRHELFSVITLTNQAGQRLVTTMSRGITASDKRIQKLKCRFNHVQYTPQ